MDNNKKFELSDEALDNVAGGREGLQHPHVDETGFLHCVRCPSYACINCGGHEFLLADRTNPDSYHGGNCRNCGTYISQVFVFGDEEVFLVKA